MNESPSPSNVSEMIALAEACVKERMAKYDPSHDWAHVNRVRNVALRIASSIKPEPDVLVVELAALFHDMVDSKYHDPNFALGDLNQLFFEKNVVKSLLTPAQIELVLRVVGSVSWSTEKRLSASGQWTWQVDCPELHCVQDADRLDAVGAIGIMRCSGFSTVRGTKLVKSDGTDTSDSAESHFDDKLFLIKDRMKTTWGRVEAEKRHQTMLTWLNELKRERDTWS